VAFLNVIPARLPAEAEVSSGITRLEAVEDELRRVYSSVLLGLAASLENQ
jgi:hypothetical protein